MSIVLEALEKAQREKKQEPVRQDQSPSVDKIRLEVKKEEILQPKIKIKRVPRKRNFYIWIGIICIAIINLWLLGWLLEPETTEDTKTIPNTNVSKVVNLAIPKIRSVTKIPEKKDTTTEITLPPLSVKGIVWDSVQPLALINGEFYTEGNIILGAELKKIRLDGVTFMYNGEEFSISVQQ